MNTTKTGMRTVLAAAAAGALILGSAGGAVADPGKAKGPKTTASEPTTATSKLQTVRIKGHKKIDLAQVDENTALKLRAKVRYSKKVESKEAPESIGMTLAVYDKKFSVDPLAVADTKSKAAKLVRKDKNKAKRNQFYAGSAVVSAVWSQPQIDVLAAEVAKNGKAYICIYDVTEKFNNYSKQTRKRLNMDVKKPVRDCVKVVNSATDSTPEAQPTS